MVDLDLRPVFEYCFKAGFGLLSRLRHWIGFTCMGRYRVLRTCIGPRFHHHGNGEEDQGI